MGYLSAANMRRLMNRDGGRCLHCGKTEGLVPQHRMNRGMGGFRPLEVPSNVILLCSEFNTRIEQDATAAEYARSRGWKLRQYGVMPEAKAVYDQSTRRWYYLDNEWNRTNAFD